MTAASITTEGGLPFPCRRIFGVILALALAGLSVSIELTRVHHSTHTEKGYKSICAVSDEINCETVARSPYSVFLGAPVSVWGIFGYTLIGFFAAWGLSNRKLGNRWAIGILTGLIVSAVGASSVLAFISFTMIDSMCLFCMSLYLINTLSAIWMVFVLVRYRINPAAALIADLAAFFKKPLLLGGVAIPSIGAIVALMFAIEPYWQHGGWKDLPTLPEGVDSNGLHWIGATDPLITVVEYSDYQCPYCRRAHRDTRIIAGKFPNDVRLVHRHFPLDNACNASMKRAFHEFACKFSRASVCASLQNKFWEMNDALFSIQDTTKAGDVNVETIAVELGLDRSKFLSCMNEKEVPRTILRDISEGARLQIEGTPTYYVNGQAFEGGISEEVITKMLANIRKARAKNMPVPK